MKTKSVTAIEAFQDKAQAVAAVLAPRLHDPGGPWETYDPETEILEGAMIGTDAVKYWR